MTFYRVVPRRPVRHSVSARGRVSPVASHDGARTGRAVQNRMLPLTRGASGVLTGCSHRLRRPRASAPASSHSNGGFK
jgi:hypothetical protein